MHRCSLALRVEPLEPGGELRSRWRAEAHTRFRQGAGHPGDEAPLTSTRRGLNAAAESMRDPLAVAGAILSGLGSWPQPHTGTHHGPSGTTAANEPDRVILPFST